MKNKAKQKRRLVKSIAGRRKEIERNRLDTAWRNIFVKAGVLRGDNRL